MEAGLPEGSRRRSARASAVLFALPLAACSASSPAGAGDLGPAADQAAAGVARAIHLVLALTADADGQHVTFPTQNGSTVAVSRADIVGKFLYWATEPGGEPATSGLTPIDFGGVPVTSDLGASVTTPAHYTDGPWEVAAVVAVSGQLPMPQPHAGDLAAFDLTPPLPGEPPITGVSVRVRVRGADATVTLDNQHFVRFGSP